jgi:thiol-disulfide isomerase/thioredoxin
VLLLTLLLLLSGAGRCAQPRDGTGEVALHFFWSASCPHCLEARPFVEMLAEEFPWLRLHSLELSGHPAHVRRYQAMAAELGEQARSVPAFFVCGRLYLGFDSAGGMGAQLRQAALSCRHEGRAARQTGLDVLPGLDASQMSLPLFTLAIAALDAFNPCAFFVLLFLLSLMVNARNRRRMLLIGGVFVLVSGLLYFVFMAAWLELFLWIGALSWVTRLAGLLAVTIGIVNIKDFFRFRQGPSLSLSERARGRLFVRMRGLLSSESLPMLLVGTVSLAVAANSYELLCTAGFPMVYTRVLTLQAGSDTHYYLYLLLYNLVYVLPLLAIVLLFSFTMGRRKLSEREGQSLKLLAGIMMALLGLLLLLLPAALNSLYAGVGLLLVSLTATWLLRRRF